MYIYIYKVSIHQEHKLQHNVTYIFFAFLYTITVVDDERTDNRQTRDIKRSHKSFISLIKQLTKSYNASVCLKLSPISGLENMLKNIPESHSDYSVFINNSVVSFSHVNHRLHKTSWTMYPRQHTCPSSRCSISTKSLTAAICKAVNPSPTNGWSTRFGLLSIMIFTALIEK